MNAEVIAEPIRWTITGRMWADHTINSATDAEVNAEPIRWTVTGGRTQVEWGCRQTIKNAMNPHGEEVAWMIPRKKYEGTEDFGLDIIYLAEMLGS